MLPRKRCETCGTLYKPFRPDQRFCTSKCRLDFHHHGGAYAKLKPLVLKLHQASADELRKKLPGMIQEAVTAALKTRGLA